MPTTLTTLPLEVRNEIYKTVFDHDRVKPRGDDRGRLCKSFQCELGRGGPCTWGVIQQTLALLSVNQQLSTEAAAYFYGKTIFRGTWLQIAAFVKGIGAQRRNLIRTIDIDWNQSLFRDDESLDMLAELASLRTVRIYGLTTDFTQLQNKTIPGCILGLVGKVDIDISVYKYGGCLSDTIPPVHQRYSDEYTWSCARNTAQSTAGEPVRCTYP